MAETAGAGPGSSQVSEQPAKEVAVTSLPPMRDVPEPGEPAAAAGDKSSSFPFGGAPGGAPFYGGEFLGLGLVPPGIFAVPPGTTSSFLPPGGGPGICADGSSRVDTGGLVFGSQAPVWVGPTGTPVSYPGAIGAFPPGISNAGGFLQQFSSQEVSQPHKTSRGGSPRSELESPKGDDSTDASPRQDSPRASSLPSISRAVDIGAASAQAPSNLQVQQFQHQQRQLALMQQQYLQMQQGQQFFHQEQQLLLQQQHMLQRQGELQHHLSNHVLADPNLGKSGSAVAGSHVPKPKVVSAHGDVQCIGSSRKTRKQCRNAALKEYIGKRPLYCAAHIMLDPDSLYTRCKYNVGRPCCETILKEFVYCFKHVSMLIDQEVARGSEGLQNLRQLYVRCSELFNGLEADTHDPNGPEPVELGDQRKKKLARKFKIMRKALKDVLIARGVFDLATAHLIKRAGKVEKGPRRKNPNKRSKPQAEPVTSSSLIAPALTGAVREEAAIMAMSDGPATPSGRDKDLHNAQSAPSEISHATESEAQLLVSFGEMKRDHSEGSGHSDPTCAPPAKVAKKHASADVSEFRRS